MATQATLEQSNSGEVWGHSGAGDGMEPFFFSFFLGGGVIDSQLHPSLSARQKENKRCLERREKSIDGALFC